MQKPKIKLLIVIVLEFWVVFTVSSFVNIVYKNKIWQSMIWFQLIFYLHPTDILDV